MKIFYITDKFIRCGAPVHYWDYDSYIDIGFEKILLSRKNPPDIVNDKVYYVRPILHDHTPYLAKPYKPEDGKILLFINNCTDTLSFISVSEESRIYAESKKSKVLILRPKDKLEFEINNIQYVFNYQPSQLFPVWLKEV